MSSKGCDHQCKKPWKKYRWILAGILIFVFLVLLTILIVWAVLRPSKPSFILQDMTVNVFNVSAPNLVTSQMQVTVSSRNPNDGIGIYYDRLHIHASYRNQQITLPTQIPPGYQGHNDISVWSPFLMGDAVPVDPYNGLELCQDQAAGSVLLTIKIDGRVRFKVGTFISGSYHLYVKCPAFIQFGSKSTGIVVGNNAIKYQLLVGCSVSV